jgi:hypothetical protein
MYSKGTNYLIENILTSPNGLFLWSLFTNKNPFNCTIVSEFRQARNSIFASYIKTL